MAAIVCPTWAEVQTMDEICLSAIGIIKGEMQGDEFMWDFETVHEDGSVSYGGWKNSIEQKERNNDGRIVDARRQ